MKLRFPKEAEVEADEAMCWYERQQDGLGDRFREDLATCVDAVSENPSRFQLCEHFDVEDEVRWARMNLNWWPLSQ